MMETREGGSCLETHTRETTPIPVDRSRRRAWRGQGRRRRTAGPISGSTPRPLHALPRARDMTAAGRTVLLVETELPVRQLVRRHLELAGFQLEETADGRTALDRLRGIPYDVLILDALALHLDGLTLCRAARAGGPNVDAAIVMVGAGGTESEKVLGLSSGADDYVTKPFGVRELLARIDAILRRAERAASAVAPAPPHRAGPLTLDVARRQAFVRGDRVDLTRQ